MSPNDNGGYYVQAELDYSEDSIRLIHTPSPQAKSMFYYVQEIGHFRTRAQYYTERRKLQSLLIVYTVAGRGHLHYRGVDHILTAGQVFFIDCMEYQTYRTDPDPGQLWELLWVHVSGESAARYFASFLEQNGGSPVMDLPTGSPIADHLRELLELHRTKHALTELLGSSLIVQLLTQLLLHAHSDRAAAHGAAFGGFTVPESVAGVAEFLNARYQEPVTLDLLARTFSISKYHLAREFKKAYGLTPNDYVLAVRINQAKAWLRDTDRPVSWVAGQSGFDYVSHFIQTFKKLEGITPLAFRKQWRSGGEG
ncbi:AraC family transcriptional regulator [Paenibacillus koleovorans]|uniref:AraC family transcriptional regulator n=1 Tax=Paenibacillus koleovorans TaxID=121608 RepID=UPI000FD7F615|nr:AraC family transcriptional regulator [Paenibacillus koleovorans]